MRKVIIAILACSLSSTAMGQDTPASGRRPSAHLGEGAGYSSRDATVLSMMGWGLGLAAGFAAICALIDNHTDTGSGGGGHSH